MVDDGVAFGACLYGQRLSGPADVVKCPGVLDFPVEIRIESHQVIVDNGATPTLIVREKLAFRACARSHEKCSKSCDCEESRYFQFHNDFSNYPLSCEM